MHLCQQIVKLFFLKKDFFVCLYVCCVCAQRVKKSVSDPLKLEFWASSGGGLEWKSGLPQIREPA